MKAFAAPFDVTEEDDSKGRGAFANRDIARGEFLFGERPVEKVLNAFVLSCCTLFDALVSERE